MLNQLLMGIQETMLYRIPVYKCGKSATYLRSTFSNWISLFCVNMINLFGKMNVNFFRFIIIIKLE